MRFEDVAGNWSTLSARLDRAASLAHWRDAEPVLAMAESINDLPSLTAEHCDRMAADALIGGLVRLAAADGGNDPDAVLVVLHLLRNGICAMAGKFAHRGPDVMALVVGEVTCQIRTYPWRRRREGFAAGLLLDAKHVLWRSELAPACAATRPYDAMLLDPADFHNDPRWALHTATEDVELVDILLWAAAAGTVSMEDLQLLLDVENRRSYGTQSRLQVAAEHGINERTLRRRRSRTLAALRDAARECLAAAA
jgi:hypothetical protein